MDSFGKNLSKSSILRKGMPTELMNELFASMPLDNAFVLLAKMPNGLLARNVQKMFNSIKEEMKNNKLNEEDCGSKLIISNEGLVVSHCGPFGFNCVRAVLQIPSFNFIKAINKPIIALYYEMEILNKATRISIGFCDQQFPLEDRWLGSQINSIGICSKEDIMIDGYFVDFGNAYEYFKKGDVIGVGIIHKGNSSMECFATWNGKLFGKAALTPNFANQQLFPATTLANAGDSIHLNFGKKEWQFKEFSRVFK